MDLVFLRHVVVVVVDVVVHLFSLLFFFVSLFNGSIVTEFLPSFTKLSTVGPSVTWSCC